jgi:phage terminase large subunit-like protein
MTVDPFTAYALSVRSGETIAGRLVCLACERHLRDRENAAAKGWRFDEATVRKAVGLFEHLHHSKGEWAGQPLILSSWQTFIVGSPLGWKRADGLRRYRLGYVEVARKKNGKVPCRLDLVYTRLLQIEKRVRKYM